MALSNTTIELTARGKIVAWLAGLAAGAAWIGGDPIARLAAALLTAPLLLDFLAKQRRLHHASVRVAPRRTISGALFSETLQIEHHGRRRLRHCLLYEPRTMRGQPAVLLPTIAPLESAQITVRQRSTIRSHVLERVFSLQSSWPLGMIETKSVIIAETDLVTLPAPVALGGDILAAADEDEAALANRSPLPGPEFHALREHLADEDVRGVHALRSASVGTLVRRVTRGRQPRTVGIVLDLRRAPGTPQGTGLRRFEWSLGACATLVESLHARGAEIEVHILDTTPERVFVREAAQVKALLTTLSEASLSSFHEFEPEVLQDLEKLAHCYWIPAGGHLEANEIRARQDRITFVEERNA
ncbi:MAG: DUF58 domain-containing protein [Planctomycetota bacterium]